MILSKIAKPRWVIDIISRVTRKSILSGLVQGVYFRVSTKTVAENLMITGWVRNCDDGRVEIKAFGSEAKFSQLLAWLKHGPKAAGVNGLDIAPIDWQILTHVNVR